MMKRFFIAVYFLVSQGFLFSIPVDENVINEISAKLKKDAYGEKMVSNTGFYAASAAILAITILGCLIYASIDTSILGSGGTESLETLLARKTDITDRIYQMRQENNTLTAQLNLLELEKRRLEAEYGNL
jgi:hypothetical protein